MQPVTDRNALEEAAGFELGGTPVSAKAFGSGHINDTFALTVAKPASDAAVTPTLPAVSASPPNPRPPPNT